MNTWDVGEGMDGSQVHHQYREKIRNSADAGSHHYYDPCWPGLGHSYLSEMAVQFSGVISLTVMP